MCRPTKPFCQKRTVVYILYCRSCHHDSKLRLHCKQMQQNYQETRCWTFFINSKASQCNFLFVFLSNQLERNYTQIELKILGNGWLLGRSV